MLEVLVGYMTIAAPWILLGVGALGLFLLIARVTVKFAAPAAKG